MATPAEEGVEPKGMAHHIMSSGRIRLALRAPEGDQQDNPFAPPPEGAPDRPWQPRPASQSAPQSAPPEDGSSDSDSDGEGGSPQGAPPPPPHGAPTAWGHGWSSQQPQGGRPDPYGRRPEPGSGGPNGPAGTGPRFDPTDPAQRRSRYALVCGGWGLIFALLGWTPVGLLLGALALYWGISALRMSPEDRAKARAEAASALADATQTPRPAPPAPGPDAQRSFVTSAWSGIITSAVTLALVATTYSLQFAYSDYFTCKNDALTSPAAKSCQDLLPSPLRDFPGLR
ncbi:hypothetical protein SAMN05216251_105290 [Actinacidiphila alni]|uniref:Integral membrane protein n=2 Tax=Actinacidiphila alni TaxID=380248 RepID=A0A1I2DLB7_9ACTN|nr:hypothetical protein SAMN05216251_105290 [Actinacidiphila alni]